MATTGREPWFLKVEAFKKKSRFQSSSLFCSFMSTRPTPPPLQRCAERGLLYPIYLSLDVWLCFTIYFSLPATFRWYKALWCFWSSVVGLGKMHLDSMSINLSSWLPWYVTEPTHAVRYMCTPTVWCLKKSISLDIWLSHTLISFTPTFGW